MLEQKKGKDFKWSKELHFAISFLGPFYTIMGLDSTEIALEDWERPFGEERILKKWHHSRTQAITVSPDFEYREDFLVLKQKISDWFKGYKYVPHEIRQMKIDGLTSDRIGISETITGTVHSALFNSWLEINAPVRGDRRYGYQEWRKVVKPSEEDIRNLQRLEDSKLKSRTLTDLTEVTLHKLWKYKALSKLPDLFQESKTGLFISIPTFSLLDFTNPALLLLTTDESEIPQLIKYVIVNNEIILSSVSHFKFKISLLSESELRLIMHVDLDTGKNGVTGDLVELLYELY